LTGVKVALAKTLEHEVPQHRGIIQTRADPMEFHIALSDTAPAPGVVHDALFDVDPTAVVDLDMSALVMRVSAAATAAELVDVLQRTGWLVTAHQVVQLPSICCGGCGG
jgi:hypothetical protein